MFTICRAMPMVSEPGGSRFRINVNILLRTSASKANDVAKSDDEEETFLLSSSSLSSSHGLSSSSLIEYYKVMTTTVSEM